jgi:hypothetical protein
MATECGHFATLSARTLGPSVRTSSTLVCRPRSPWAMATVSRVPPLTDAERAALMLEVRRAGETAASRRLGLSRNLMARALARLKIQPGSVLLIRNALAAVASDKTTPQQGAA